MGGIKEVISVTPTFIFADLEKVVQGRVKGAKNIVLRSLVEICSKLKSILINGETELKNIMKIGVEPDVYVTADVNLHPIQRRTLCGHVILFQL